MLYSKLLGGLIFLGAFGDMTARAKELFVVEATGVTNLTVSGSSLPDLIGDAIAARGAFVNLGDSSATFTLNYAGVADALRVSVVTPPGGGVGTYSASIDLPGYTRTFTATSRQELRDLVTDFLNRSGDPVKFSGSSSGHGDLLKALKKIYASTPVTVTDGTPHSTTATLSNREFDEFGLRHGLTGDESAALRRGVRPESNAFSVEADYGWFETKGGFTGTSLTVTPTLRLGDRWGFVFALPVRYLNIEGAKSGETGFLMGIPLQVVSQGGDGGFFWQVTPFVHSAIAASYDMLQAAIDIGGGFTNRVGYDFGWCTVQVASQIGYFDGIDISNYDIGVEQQVLKNGVKLSLPISGGWLVEGRAVRTDFLKDAAVPAYYTFGADFVYRSSHTDYWAYVLVPDDIYLGILCDTDLKSYNSLGARGCIRWKW
jgi:hypothetical protein